MRRSHFDGSPKDPAPESLDRTTGAAGHLESRRLEGIPTRAHCASSKPGKLTFRLHRRVASIREKTYSGCLAKLLSRKKAVYVM